MGFSASQYLRMILNLLPTGLAWSREPETNTYKVCDALAQEASRVDARAQDLLKEADPRTSVELLPDWERVTGLPDECAGPAQTLEDRRNAVVSVLAASGSINREFFIDFAAALGYTVTIYEYRQFLAGRSRAGDPLSNGLWVFVWEVRAPLNTVKYFRAGRSLAGEALAVWGNTVLECAIKKRAPAGTKVIFSYGG